MLATGVLVEGQGEVVENGGVFLVETERYQRAARARKAFKAYA